ncbi:hypothetical protein PENTCL1PPCAC_14978, partial [Pristionchus entomophagus]
IYQESPTASSRSSTNPMKLLPGDPLDPLDAKRVQTIRDAIDNIINQSTYDRERVEQFKAALSAVCFGELNANAASVKFDVPSTSVVEYAMRLRLHLGSILPPKMNPYIREKKENKKKEEKKVYGGQTIRTAINSVVKKNMEIEPLKKAIYAICIGELTVSEATKKYHVNQSSVRASVHKTLRKLNRPLPKQVKKDEGQRIGDLKNMTTREEETVTIDGSSLVFLY